MQAACMKFLCDLIIHYELSLQNQSFPEVKETNALLYSKKLLPGVIEIPGTQN